ncbi:hypothetical protein EMPS_00556 [Entomortierella parvispora]|uniref:LysM domain-containing protein n=1 Tax=Entomortierella parvispora TaxID=205924 RepID=A0A9P3H1B7_9FUNG|nr:hypothetical protein EMPS_00556 [Entomortierella parvispora]
MKFSVTIAALALGATQVMAVIPEPVKECTKSVIVSVANDTCVAFAGRHGTTFDDMLKWNNKLRKDCLNLDFGHPICVSITQGECCLNMTEPAGPSTPVTPPTSAVSVTLPATSAPPPSGTGTSVTPKPTGGPSTTGTLPPANTQTSEAAGVKGSMMIAAAGVLLSVAYML